MTGALDRVVAGCYGAVPASAAVTCLLAPREAPLPLRELPAAGPGAATPPSRRESLVTRYVRGIREHWATQMRFPNPLQAVVLAIGFGLCILLGGSDRLASPTFTVIREHGGAAVWGLAYLGVSVSLFVAWRWWRHGLVAAYVMAASGYLLFALATFRPAWEQPSVNYLATFLASWLVWVHAMAANRHSGEWHPWRRITMWFSHIRRWISRGRRTP